MSLNGKKIVLAITGSIAAYKMPLLVRLLIKAGAEVQVVMTEAAKDFVTPLTLSTLSRNAVFSSVQQEGQWNNHVHLGRWADLMVIAPCSANTLAKMTLGLCDNMILAVYLSAACPVMVAPAMDEDMWHHAATRENIDKLRARGHSVLPVQHGSLASGLTGEGRMAEPEEIFRYINERIGEVDSSRADLSGKHMLITAGPTVEAIDPVRYIGNHSSGKMGIALAAALAARGCSVDLVLGPVMETIDHPLVQVHSVTTAAEMFACCEQIFPTTDGAILAAAVADFRPETVADQKIKKEPGSDIYMLRLVKNPDILASLSRGKQAGQIVVGFALETQNAVANAEVKLQQKGADMIVLNSLEDPGAGFGGDTNQVTILKADGSRQSLPLASKTEIARAIVACIFPKEEQ